MRRHAAHLSIILHASFALAPIAHAGECGTPGRDGSGAISGIVNTYWNGASNPTAGATSFALGPARGAAQTIAPGDLLMLIQTQDANINTSNTLAYGDGSATAPASGATALRRAGRFEFVRAANAVGAAGGTLSVASPVVYDYSNQAPTNTRGNRRFQIVRVPQYLDASVTGTLSALPWDGTSGGIVAIDVANTLTFSGGTIDASEAGFRGGGGRASQTGSGNSADTRTAFANGANGSKGEGFAGTPRLIWNGTSVTDLGTNGIPQGSFARGAPSNAGGGGTDENPSINDRNTGAGGGGGYGDGGRGGHAWCPGGPNACAQSGGFGGRGTANLGVNRIAFGGGGGAGTTNNATGTPGNGQASSGATGGGLVILRAGSMTGSGTIRVDGEDANQTVGNDGSGGGGGGGSVLLSAKDSPGLSLSVFAEGGLGGTNGNSSPHGPGGGGGGGYIAYTTGVSGVSGVVTGGQPGTTDGNTLPFDVHYGATAGTVGRIDTVSSPNIPGFSSGDECRVDIAKVFAPDQIEANVPSTLTLTLSNPNPSLSMAALAVTDPLPSNVVVASNPNAQTTCGGSVTAAAGSSSVELTGGTLASGASCTVDVDVVATSAGTFDNVIPVGNASATLNGISVLNTLVAEDTLTVTAPLTASKTLTIVTTPDNPGGFATPGAMVEYTIAFSNPGPIAVNGIDLRDTLPAEAAFVGSDIDGPGSGPAAFDDGSPSTTLTANFTYSNDGGVTFGYTPSQGEDHAVTHVRFEPTGSMASGTSGAIRFRMRIK